MQQPFSIEVKPLLPTMLSLIAEIKDEETVLVSLDMVAWLAGPK